MAEVSPPLSPDTSIELTPANVGLAFGLVIAAGAATSVGAAIAFLVKINNHKILALALGLSAGVMLYVSFVEIFATKSIQGFEDAGFSTDQSYQYATLSFFAGMVLTWILDHVCHGLMHLSAWLDKRKEKNAGTPDGSDADEVPTVTDRAGSGVEVELSSEPTQASLNHANSTSVLVSPGLSSSAGVTLNSTTRRRSVDKEYEREVQSADTDSSPAGPSNCLEQISRTLKKTTNHVVDMTHTEGETSGVDMRADAPQEMGDGIAQILAADHHAGLKKMSESHSKWKAFTYASLSGLAEPIGALIGYAALQGRDMDPLVYALLFGIVAGIMVWISIRELLPTALRYDPEDQFTTLGVFAGFAIMAASLIMFTI
eukprot:gene11404-12107_t